ncbi:MAG: BACON domain-containing protein [Synergistaceae bacterium]|nr:BACON domain-containing protein [Synergistaceae bacterium]
MKHISNFRALVLLSFFVFTVMCSGGCGGSSTSTGIEKVSDTMRVFSIGNIEDVDNKDSVMYVFMVILHELLGTSDELSTITSRDALMVFSFGESDQDNIIDSLNENAAVILLCPTREIIQKLVNAVGLRDYKVPEISKGEIFAIKRGSDEANLFYMPSQASLVETNSETVITSDDVSHDVSFVADTREAVYPEPIEEDDFQQERFNDFISWLGASEDVTITATDVNSSRPVLRGTVEYDLSYTGSDDQYGTRRHIWKAYYTAYSLHSFEDGSDYYIVELRSKSNPKSQFSHSTQTLKKTPLNDHIPVDCTVDVATGYKRLLSFKHTISNDEDGDIDTLVAIPLPNGTNSVSWPFGGRMAYSWQRGGNVLNFLEVERSLTYTNNLANDRTGTTLSREEANWDMLFSRPSDGADHIEDIPYSEATDYKKTYKGINVTDASSKIRTDYFAWVWRVPKDYWQKNGSPKFFQATASSIHGRTEGSSFYSPVSKSYRVPRVDMNWYGTQKTINVPLPTPPHIAMTADMGFNTRAEANGSFTLASEEDWTATSDSDWLTVNPASGSATNGIIVSFHLDANNTGADRSGTVTFKCSQSGETARLFITQRK